MLAENVAEGKRRRAEAAASEARANVMMAAAFGALGGVAGAGAGAGADGASSSSQPQGS